MTIPKYQLLIKTNQYTGNFSRELLAYTFGCCDTGQEWVNDLAKLAEKELGEDFADSLSSKLYYYCDEYGQTVGEILGRNNFVVYFSKSPTDKELNILKERINKFPEALAKSWEFAPKNVEIKNVEFTEFKEK